MNNNILPLTAIEHLQIVMGYQCNQKCIFCYQEDQSINNKMNPEIWQKYLRPVYDNLKSVTIIGGEPTIMGNAKAFLEMLYDKYPNVMYETITNGINFKGIWQDAFLARGLNVIFSLHAASRETYSKITQYGNWDNVMENIKNFAIRRKESGSSVGMKATFVIVDENNHELRAFVDLCRDLSMDECSFNLDFRAISRGINDRFKDTLLRLYEDTKGINDIKILGLQECLSLVGEKVEVVRESYGTTYYKEICPIPWKAIHVGADGFVSVCCSSWLFLGNINKHSIAELWNNSVARKMRDTIAKKDYSMCKKSCSINVNPKVLNQNTKFVYPLLRYCSLFVNNPVQFVDKSIKRVKSICSMEK